LLHGSWPKHLIAARQQVKSMTPALMETRPPSSLVDHYAAALDWWRDAGVDHDWQDTAHCLLEDPAAKVTEAKSAPPPAPKRAEAPPPPVERPIGGDRAAWPAALPDFATWWMAEPSLGAGGLSPRVAPRGAAGAALMVVVPMPEADDVETLLSAQQGRMVANMLRAMGIADDAAYVAAALPRYTPSPDWEGLSRTGLGAVLRHHIALAAPRRVLMLGQNLPPLLDLAKRPGAAMIDTGKINIPCFASFAPDVLLANTPRRADLWRGWLEWTAQQ
jgi:hypothetical protein